MGHGAGNAPLREVVVELHELTILGRPPPSSWKDLRGSGRGSKQVPKIRKKHKENGNNNENLRSPGDLLLTHTHSKLIGLVL